MASSCGSLGWSFAPGGKQLDETGGPERKWGGESPRVVL